MSPSKLQARKLVLVSALLLAVIAVYRDRRQGTNDTFRALWGVGVVSFVLSLLADFAPGVAGPFAALTVLGSLSSGGDSLIQRMLGTIAKTEPGSATAPHSANGGNFAPATNGGNFAPIPNGGDFAPVTKG